MKRCDTVSGADRSSYYPVWISDDILPAGKVIE